MRLIVIAACLACGLRAQAPPAFDVASVRPAASGPMGGGMNGGPGSDDPERINYKSVTLENVLIRAYNVRYDEIAGPSWLPYERYDILANVPPGTSKEQLLLMLQNLVAERFKMTSHIEKREHAAYDLVIAKGGPKLTLSKDDTEAPAPAPAREGPLPRAVMGRDGYPEVRSVAPGHIAWTEMSGMARVDAPKVSMAEFVRYLTDRLDRRVRDSTGLTGVYDFMLTFSAAGLPAGTARRALELALGGPSTIATPEEGGGAGLFAALQNQLGLKLESKKELVDVLVIDHIEKVPTEN